MNVQRPPLLTEDLANAYRDDGVVCVRQAISSDDVDVLRREVARALADKGPNYKNHTKRNGGTAGAFESSFGMWETNATLADFGQNSNLPSIAGALMDSRKVNLFFDQCFVKQPGTNDPTPWHNDQPFWPIRGDQVITLWIALDTLTPESSVVEFVRGSHLWKRWFQAKAFSGENNIEDNPEFEEMIDIEADRESYDIISWNLSPGDVLAFHGMMLHGSQANVTRDMLRRSYCIRYTGDDVVYDPRVGTTEHLFKDDLVRGGSIDGPDYPVVWQS